MNDLKKIILKYRYDDNELKYLYYKKNNQCMVCDNNVNLCIIDTNTITIDFNEYCKVYNKSRRLMDYNGHLNYSIGIYRLWNHVNRHKLDEKFIKYNKNYILCEKCLYNFIFSFFIYYQIERSIQKKQIYKNIKLNKKFIFLIKEYKINNKPLYDCFEIKIKKYNRPSIYKKIKLYINGYI